MKPRLTIKEITSWFVDRHGEDYERKITTKWIGSVIRKRLNLRARKSHGVFVILPSEEPKLVRLYEKYGIGARETDESSPDQASIPLSVDARVDVGDVGDMEKDCVPEELQEKPSP